MKYIYYPEYELEYRNMTGKMNGMDHILNIRLLMFIGEHIVIPPSHLLRMDSTNILTLINNLKEFFSNGRIVTTQYSRGIDDYFLSRIERSQNVIEKMTLEIRAKQIMQELLFNTDKIEQNKSDENLQLGIFNQHFRELLTSPDHYKKHSLLLLDEMDSLSDRTGEMVYSNQLEDLIRRLNDKGDINKRQKTYFEKLLSNSYYFSGTYTMQATVSYNMYFEKIDLRNTLKHTHKMATNMIADPRFLMRVFESIGINAKDIFLLDAVDYDEVLSHKYWRNFQTIFETIFTDAIELEEMLNNPLTLSKMYGERKRQLERMLGVNIDRLIAAKSSQSSLGSTLSFVIYALSKIASSWSKMKKTYDRNASEKILNLLYYRNNPIFDFSCRLRIAIESLREDI